MDKLLADKVIQRFTVDIDPVAGADVIRAMGDYNNRRPENAKALIDGHLADNPLSIPAIRVHLKSQGKPNDEDAVCRYLKEQIAQGITLPNR